jgi:Spherulation-specific family 4
VNRRFAAGALALVASVVLASGCASRQCVSRHASLIPAYVAPDQLVALAAHPDPTRLVVINPHNGPGAAADPSYRRAIDSLRGTSAEVLGYVATDYGRRDPRLVRRDISRYATWYGIHGLFVDEVPTSPTALTYYADVLGTTARRSDEVIVLNPGRVPAPGYFELGDVVVTFEGTYRDYVRRSDAADPADRDVAHLIFEATDREAVLVAAAQRARYVYASEASLPNPWGRLARTVDTQRERLQRC